LEQSWEKRFPVKRRKVKIIIDLMVFGLCRKVKKKMGIKIKKSRQRRDQSSSLAVSVDP